MTYHSSVRDKGWFQTEHNAQAVETDASLVLRKFSARYVCVPGQKLAYLLSPPSGKSTGSRECAREHPLFYAQKLHLHIITETATVAIVFNENRLLVSRFMMTSFINWTYGVS